MDEIYPKFISADAEIKLKPENLNPNTWKPDTWNLKLAIRHLLPGTLHLEPETWYLTPWYLRFEPARNPSWFKTKCFNITAITYHDVQFLCVQATYGEFRDVHS